ncbi:MAG: polyprenol monophosphomannose synthase [Gammaproteobacteria bacterium]|jgi:dolichol-phosphate mannosyltransferase|nr:polyprenol monophosphomannose synthase [Gammaproteobacteria bacterium]
MNDRPATPRISLIVPTFNEATNVESLIKQIDANLTDTGFELVFADDSTDATPEIIRKLAATDERIKLCHRDRSAGLASAVVEALPEAFGEFVAVMDADLQHPPAVVPQMIEHAKRHQGDIIVASRYAVGGRDSGLSGPARRIGSKIGRLAAYTLLPESRRTTDPLSGFFLFRRAIVEGIELRPLGFKILLEILVRCRPRRVLDVPFHFQQRTQEQSKASAVQVLNYARHLLRLRR